MNWYFVTPLVEVAFELIQSKIGDFRPIDKQYKVIVRKLNNWLVNMPCHWGAVDKARKRIMQRYKVDEAIKYSGVAGSKWSGGRKRPSI